MTGRTLLLKRANHTRDQTGRANRLRVYLSSGCGIAVDGCGKFWFANPRLHPYRRCGPVVWVRKWLVEILYFRIVISNKRRARVRTTGPGFAQRLTNLAGFDRPTPHCPMAIETEGPGHLQYFTLGGIVVGAQGGKCYVHAPRFLDLVDGIHFGPLVPWHERSSPSTMFTAALLGAILGFSLGGMFINRRTRKRG